MRPIVVRIFANFTPTHLSDLLGRDEKEFQTNGIQIFFNQSGSADLVFVLNYSAAPYWVTVPRGNLIKILQEPTIRNPISHLFTYRHSRIFDQVITHSPEASDERQIRFLPCTGSFIDPMQLEQQPFDQKHHTLSMIASNLAILPGHRLRLQFVEMLLSRFPQLEAHTFGRGRRKELAQKVDGLREYRFSVAIENSSLPSYVTEKFYDCIIAGCVPLYYGAPDIANYFPSDCFIPLPVTDFEECCQIINELSDQDYERRIPALIEARRLIRDRYSLGAVILDRVAGIQDVPQARKRFVFLFRIDSIICQIQKLGFTKWPGALLNKFRVLSRV